MKVSVQQALLDERIIYVRKISGPLYHGYMRVFNTLADDGGHYRIRIAQPVSSGLENLELHLQGILFGQLKRLPRPFVLTLARHLTTGFATTPTDGACAFLREIIKTFVNEGDYESANEFADLIGYL